MLQPYLLLQRWLAVGRMPQDLIGCWYLSSLCISWKSLWMIWQKSQTKACSWKLLAVSAKCQSIKNSGSRPFIKVLYQAILLFILPCLPELYLPKQNEKRAWSQLRTLSEVKTFFLVIFVRFIYSFTEHHAWLKTVHGPVVQISMADTSAPSLLNDS